MNKDFEEILQKVKEQLPGLRVKHGGMDVPLKPKTPVHPMVKLMTYINKNNIRLVDFFNKFDKDGSMSVTPDEFYQGLQVRPSAGATGEAISRGYKGGNQ